MKHVFLTMFIGAGLVIGASQHASASPCNPATLACDFSQSVPAQTPINLTGAVTPPRGFEVQEPGGASLCAVEDDVANTGTPFVPVNPGASIGFLFGGNGSADAPATFVSPQAYQPMGPVYVYCLQATRLEVRTW